MGTLTAGEWGFTRHTQSTTPNPAPHQPQHNQATRVTQSYHDRHNTTDTHNRQTQADRTQNIAPSCDSTPIRHLDHRGQNIPLTANPTDHLVTPAPNPGTTNYTDTNQANDSYLEPWGDPLQQPKPPNMIRICLQNFGGWPTSAKHQKNDNIRRFVNSAEVDVLITTENNIAWHKLTTKN